LRSEIGAMIKEEGWSRDSVWKLQKLDSFMTHQSVRNFALGALQNEKDFTFSDGTTIPAGCSFQPCASRQNKFDGFRFERMRGQGGEETKHQLVS
ncbi:hypothetical protein JOM56_009469, partial [Amanita muscaria]